MSVSEVVSGRVTSMPAVLLAQLAGQAGFLPTRGSVMLDFVFLAMFAIVLVMGFSIWLVRTRRMFQWHKRIQIATAVVLLATIVAFEIDMRLITDWRKLAEPSRFMASGAVDTTLAIHLMFAIPTPVIWIITIVHALRNFPNPPQPGPCSARHRKWGWLSVVMMSMTAVTGWIFYWVAFVA
jgi:uncharacterized membrane protein YozB (DUF420 family)